LSQSERKTRDAWRKRGSARVCLCGLGNCVAAKGLRCALSGEKKRGCGVGGGGGLGGGVVYTCGCGEENRKGGEQEIRQTETRTGTGEAKGQENWTRKKYGRGNVIPEKRGSGKGRPGGGEKARERNQPRQEGKSKGIGAGRD